MIPILAALAAIATTPNPADSPLFAHTQSIDRGAVKSGPTLSSTITLTNRGTGRLTITAVEGGCGCVRAAVSCKESGPGDKTVLGIDVNTLTQPEGPNVWRVALRYQVEPPANTPPRTFTTEIRMTANLTREVSVTPPAAAISTAGEGSLTLTVTDRRTKPLKITKSTTSSPHINTTILPAEVHEGRHAQRIELKLSADAPIGHRDESVRLTTDDPAYPELVVPVRVSKRVDGAVVAAPDAVTLRFAAGRAESSAVVVVRSPSGGRVKIDRAECDDVLVRLKWSVGAGAAATMRVTVPAGPLGRAEVRILLAEPAGHVLRIPVTWSND